jgi:hypothetical protein
MNAPTTSISSSEGDANPNGGMLRPTMLRWQLLRTSYQARDGDEILVLFEPWRLQPGLSAGGVCLVNEFGQAQIA